MAEVILVLVGLLSLFMTLSMVFFIFRVLAVTKTRTLALDIVDELNKRDLEELEPVDFYHPLIVSRGLWRFDLFDRITFDEMVWRFWKSPSSFFENCKELDPNVHTKEIVWS